MEKLNHKMYAFADKYKKQIKYIAIVLCILIFLLEGASYGLKFGSKAYVLELWRIISDIRYCFRFPIRSFSYFIYDLYSWVLRLSPLFLAYAVFREKQSLRIGTIIMFIVCTCIRVIHSICDVGFHVYYFAFNLIQISSYLLLLYAINGRKQSIMAWSIGALACYLLTFLTQKASWIFTPLFWIGSAPILILPIYSMAYYQQPLIFCKPKGKAQSAISSSNKINTLTKAKELLDAGIITQEEFDAKKKEILGL